MNRGYTAHSGTSYSDGRNHPIWYASGTDGYVMKAERIVEYRYSSPDEPLVDHRRHRQLSQVHDRPDEVEDFLTNVQVEASRPVTKVSAPFTSSWRARPNPAGKDHGTGTKNYAYDNNDFQDKQSEAYPQLYKGTKSLMSNKDMYPSSNHGPTAPSHRLSKPTNDIGTAVDFLAEAIKPNYGANKGLNSTAQDRKMDSGEDEQTMYGRDRIPNFEPTKPINNIEGYVKANGNGSPMYFGWNPAPTTRNKDKYSPPETIDRTEAHKQYGNPKNQPVPEDAYNGKIDSNVALKKYNGAKVPPPETIDSTEARKRYGNPNSQPVQEDAYTGKIDSNVALKTYNGAKVPW